MEQQKGQVVAVCLSEKKGTAKQDVGHGLLVENHGLENDAHAGGWHRQLSLLSQDKVDEFCARGAQVGPGAFGENLLVRGIDLAALPVGSRLRCGDILLEVTQIGKECHAHCAIYHQVGDCIMPREGIFTRVLQGGEIAKGDELYVEEALPGGSANGQ